MIHLPAAPTVPASAGTGQAARRPAHAIRPSRMTTTAFRTAGAPVPSTSVAPTIAMGGGAATHRDRKSTRLNSSHSQISYAVFCLKKKNYKDHPLFTQETTSALPGV